MDASNDVGAGDDQQVVVALQLIRMALVPITPEVLLTQPVHARCIVKLSCQSQSRVDGCYVRRPPKPGTRERMALVDSKFDADHLCF